MSFNSNVNANTWFFSESAESLLQNLPCPKNEFGIKTTTEYHKQIWNEWEDFVLHNTAVTTADKILLNVDIAKASGIHQISAKCFKVGVTVIAIHLPNINLSMKLGTFFSR